MGDDEDEFDVNTSDQTASEPTSESTPPAPPQIDNLDDTGVQESTGDSPNVDGGAPAQNSEDSGNFNVSVSDDTAHTADQPPVDPQVTIGPDDRSGSGDDRPEEQHDEERDNLNERIEEDGNREADPEPPGGE